MGKRVLGIVLGGGGARGALQVGALRALLEAGLRPDIIVGTSAGALNAGALAVYGLDLDGVARLERAWRAATEVDLLPSQSWWTLMRALFRRAQRARQEQLRELLINQGLAPHLRFGDIRDVRVGMVAADMNTYEMVVYGERPDDFVLEGILASTALVPWLPPLEVNGRYLIDGGAVSNVPIQVAMDWGATEIIALDLADDRILGPDAQGITVFMTKLLYMVSYRQTALELALAEARGIPVHYVHLQSSQPVAIWDFSRTEALFSEGYALMKEALAGRESEEQRPEWLRRMVERVAKWR